MDYEHLKMDLHTHISSLETDDKDLITKNRLANKINLIKSKISKLNLERGKQLADRLKTKWYNEGERSNKYFLALLKRREAMGQLNELEINGNHVTDEKTIEAEITRFYTDLYNQQLTQKTDDELAGLLRNLEELNHDEIAKIQQPITLAMLKETLRDSADSCPGPDGIPYSYIKLTWTSLSLL